MRHKSTGEPKEVGPAPLPRAHLDEIVLFYRDRVTSGEPVEEIREQSRFFRPEVRRVLDRELDHLTPARHRR